MRAKILSGRPCNFAVNDLNIPEQRGVAQLFIKRMCQVGLEIEYPVFAVDIG
jgi:hypothetical protein